MELVTFYDVEEGFMGNLTAYSAEMEKVAPAGYFGNVVSAAIEQLKREGGDKDGKEDNGTAANLCIAWESKEAHLEFSKTKLLKDLTDKYLMKMNGGAIIVSRVSKGGGERVLLMMYRFMLSSRLMNKDFFGVYIKASMVYL
jgi:hypothetical protein